MAGKPATMGGAYGYIMQAFAKAPPISFSLMTTRSSLYETRSLRHWTGHHSRSRLLCLADSPLLSSPQRLQQEKSVAGELWACRLSRSRPHRARVLTETECSSEYEFRSPRRSEWPPYIKAPSTLFISGWRRQCVCGKCCCEHWVHSNRACTAVRSYGEEIQHKHIQKECTFHLRLITSLRPPLGGLLLETIQLFATRAEAWQAIPGVSDWVLGIIKWGYTLQFARRPPRLAAWSPHWSSIAMMLTFISRWPTTTGDSWDSPLREWLINILPFGLSLAPRTFTKCMDAALSPLRQESGNPHPELVRRLAQFCPVWGRASISQIQAFKSAGPYSGSPSILTDAVRRVVSIGNILGY